MIRAVIFDYGNVISEDNTAWSTSEMEKLTGIPAKVFVSVYGQIRQDFDRGLITGIEMYRQLLDSAGYHEQARNDLMLQQITELDMEGWKTVRPEVTDWGLSLQKKGFKLGILSNMPTEFLAKCEKEIALFRNADYACFSCNLHLIKPDPAIYRECLKKIGVKADEAVFFDDIQKNIDAANALGIHGFLFTGIKKAISDFDNLLTAAR